MVGRGWKIIWSPRAVKQFSAAIEYIRRDSEQNADSVKEKILSKITRLTTTKATYRLDPYKISNDGHFFYFEIVSYRVSYYKKDNEIIIVCVRHVSMRPLHY